MTPQPVPAREGVKRAPRAQNARARRAMLDAGIHPIAERLNNYRAAVDEVVVLRAITPTDSLEDCLSFVSEARTVL